MKNNYKKPFVWLLSGAGLSLLLFWFVRWQMENPFRPFPQKAAASVSVLLFAVVGLLAVQRWADFWSSEPDPAADTVPAISGWKIFLALVAWDALILLLAWPLRCLLSGNMTLQQSMEAWVSGDSYHYLCIAQDWYLSSGSIDRVVQLVFLPGYPILIRLVHLIIPNWTYAALTVSGICFALAGTVLYRLACLDLGPTSAKRALAALCFFPGSFFFAAPMSESLFLLCCIGCLYLARRGKWLPACLLGAYAAFTRSLGITLLVPLILELVHDRKKTRRTDWVSMLVVPLGFAAYLLINQQVAGNPFQFLIYQSEHWHQNLGLFFNTAAYQTDYAIGTFQNEPHNFWGLWLPNLTASFGALILMLLAGKKLRGSWMVWFIPYYFIAIGATWLLSAPRYLLVFFPLSEAVSVLMVRKGLRIVLFVLLGLLSFLYFLAFLLRWQVY